MRLSFIVAGCALAALSASGHAQSYGVAEVTDGNLKFTATLTGVGTAAGYMLSGTKCEVAFTVSVTTGPAGGGSTHIYDSWVLADPSLKIGTTSIPGIPDAPDPGEPYGTTVRFASNHFNHNENIPIEGKIYVCGADTDGYGHIIAIGTVYELKAEVLPKAYNVGRCWATFVGSDGVPQSIENELTGAFQARQGCEYFHLKHGLLKHDPPASDAPLYRLKQEGTTHTLQDRLIISTLIHAETHGSFDGLADSYTTGVNPWSAISGYLFGGRTAPEPNFVSAFACRTLEPSNSAAKAFHVLGADGSTIADKAYVGFDLDVAAVTLFFPNEYYYLSDKTERLYSELTQGHLLEESIGAANLNCPSYVEPIVMSGPGTRANLKMVGDPRTRLYLVYMTSEDEERNGGLADTWYFVLAPLP